MARPTPSTFPRIAQANKIQTTPRIVSPMRAAQSRWRRPCPATMSAGKARSVPRLRTVPATTTAAGHRAPETNSVHHGTPNSSNPMPLSAPNRSARTDRRAGAAAGTASVADTPTLLGVGTTPSMTRRANQTGGSGSWPAAEGPRMLRPHLSGWEHDQVDLEVSLKDTKDQKVTLQAWLAGRAHLVATSHEHDLDHALAEVRRDLIVRSRTRGRAAD